MAKKKTKTTNQTCRDCRGERLITCPTCKGTGGDPDDTCCACRGAGEIGCFRCGGTGLEPEVPTSRETVELPWGRARIVDLVNVAGGDRHGPSLELLEYPDGKQALRFSAFYDGQLVASPLVLDAEAIPHLATAAASSKPIHAFLKRLAACRSSPRVVEAIDHL